jgi:hypothetical protein
MYGIRMSFSPTEKPSTADDYTEKQNPLAIARLENLQLDGRGWIIILDFPEVSIGPSLLLPILIKYSIQTRR